MSAARTARRVAVGVAVAAVMIVTAPAPASAHSVLLGTTPADGTEVDTLTTEVTVAFNEPPQADFSTVVVTGPGDVAYGEGAVRVVDNVVHQAVYPLHSGAYRVAWRVVSADGHPISGSFEFTVTLPPALEPTGAPPTAAAASVAGSGGWAWWWVAVLVVLVVGVLLGIRAVDRRRRAP